MLWYLAKKERRQIMKKRSGFTLAEVLITLGIIGVVAAMTIPTLIANTNSARFRSQFKKSVSTLAQAGLMAQAQFDIDYSSNDGAGAAEGEGEGGGGGCSTTANPEGGGDFTFCAIFNGTLSGHTLSSTPPVDRSGNQYLTSAGGEGEEATNSFPVAVSNPMYLTLADGSLVVFDGAAANCHKATGETLSDYITNHDDCIGFIDVNGATLPNRAVRCEDGTSDVGITDNGCAVPNDAAHMGDIYPIAFHDASVEPASDAAKYVLTTSK